MQKSIRGINFNSLVVAGAVAGYLMYFADKMFAGLFGLFGFFPGTDNAWWMLTHHIDAIIFAIPFAWPAIYDRLPGAGWLKGLIYGFLWWLVFLLILGWIAGALGAKPFQQMAPKSAAMVFTPLLLHLVWGFFLGVLYNPTGETLETAI